MKYSTPSEEVFNNIKEKCINTWNDMTGANPAYIKAKLDRINNIRNVEADVMFMLAMFHPLLRNHVIQQLSEKSKEYINNYNKLEDEEIHKNTK